VRQRTAGRWQAHLAQVFESAARDHARRLAAAEAFPPETVVGRWWKDETVEIDVLALAGDQPVLVGECRWQAGPLTVRDLGDLQRRSAHLPEPALLYAFWSRGGADAALAGRPEVRTFTPADLVDG
jgi:hypothetical protein